MRTSRPWLRATLAALCLAPAMLSAQVYRCASTYSDRPCPGGASIDVDDHRSTAQKAQTDAATAQARRQAEQMEQSRLEAERPPLASPARPGKPAAKRATRTARAQAAKTHTPNMSPQPGSMRKTTKTGTKGNRMADDPGYFTATARKNGKNGNTAATQPVD